MMYQKYPSSLDGVIVLAVLVSSSKSLE